MAEKFLQQAIDFEGRRFLIDVRNTDLVKYLIKIIRLRRLT